MKFSRSGFEIGVALIMAALASTAIALWPRERPTDFCFEVTMRSSFSGFAQLFYDVDSGANRSGSSRLPIQGGSQKVTYKFPLPEGSYTSLRFVPSDQSGNTMTLSDARITHRTGSVLRAIRPEQFKASGQLERLEASSTEVTLLTAGSDGKSSVTVELGEPLVLKNFSRESFTKVLRRFLRWFLATAVAGLLVAPTLLRKRRPEVSRWSGNVLTWGRTHPQQAVLVTAVIFVVSSCYPIVFFGKSFLSPNNHPHTFLLYGEMPTVPSYQETETDDEKGADLGAAMWQNWPYSVVASTGFFKYGELPLWNRHNSCGLPLLGQGLSMCADPLQLLVLFTGGASAAWDLKYLLAKLLFASCLGLCILQAAKHLPAALIIAATAPFIGFFSYRYAHPAFFSLCYAPSILLCWFKLVDARSGRETAVWLAAMVLADWTLLNSGSVKEAYVLLLAMNLCGFLTLLLGRSIAGGKKARFFQAVMANVLFVAIAMPVWLTFFHALQNSATAYDAGGVWQLQPGLLIGLFDDIFYRQFSPDERHLDPSLNFLALLGVLWFFARSRRVDPGGLSRGLGITCLIALLFVFGIAPPWLIIRFPLLKNILHIDNTFSCVAIVCLLPLAGFGIKAFWQDCQTDGFKQTYCRVLVILAVLMTLYFLTSNPPRGSIAEWFHRGEPVPKSNFFWGYSLSLMLAVAVVPWLGRWAVLAKRVRASHLFFLALLFVLFHWRHGMHLATPFDAYVMNPQRRVNLVADSSAALKLIKSDATQPSRTAGLDSAFFPGYGGAVGVEQIDGPDPLVNKYYRALMDAFGIKRLFGAWRYGVLNDRLQDDLPLFDMLNVRYFLGDIGTKVGPVPSLKKVAALDLDVYESEHVWPRAFFTDGLVACEHEEEFIHLLKKSGGTPFAGIPSQELTNQAELAKLINTAIPFGNRKATPATDYVFTNNTTSFKVNATGPGVIVLTETFVSDDFQLRVNGKPANYFRVNSAFKGLFVQGAGDYVVSFAYWPRYLTLSLWIAGAGLVILLGWMALLLKTAGFASRGRESEAT